MSRKNKVAYFYDPDIGEFYYGQGHPMKPHRVRMAHSLILHYGLYNHMDCYRPRPATVEDMTVFHADDYVSFLQTVTQDRQNEFKSELELYNLLDLDCPVFDGLYKYCTLYSGASLGAAVKLNYNTADIAINWSGGLHHGKKGEASGFCYINDIVLAILELLKYHQRVLYIDIDVHHGDGVEEAFLTTDRVLTFSLHKFGGGFFPGTGDITNIGYGPGRHYALNAPLKDGITDEAYQSLFRPVVAKIMDVFCPEVVVLQCGADSLAGDRLGVFNLSSNGHAACVHYLKSFGIPLMLLGGGGYKIVNVARCWAKETGAAVGVDMDEALPASEYDDYYAPIYQLTVQPKPTQTDQNSKEYLDLLRIKLLEHLSHVAPVPSVPFYERPPDAMQEQDIEPIASPAPSPSITLPNATSPRSPLSSAGMRRPARMWSGLGGGSSAVDRLEVDRLDDFEASMLERQLSSRARMDIDYKNVLPEEKQHHTDSLTIEDSQIVTIAATAEGNDDDDDELGYLN